MVSPDHHYMPIVPGKPCVFLEGTLCGIWEDRPEGCKAFPLKFTEGCLLSGWQRKPKVVLAAPRYRGENELWRNSFDKVLETMKIAGIYEGHIVMSGVRVDDNRNQICHKFLREFPLADYLVMVDDDMTFHPMFVEKLLSRQQDIVCGVYFQRGDKCYPHVYRYDGMRVDDFGEWATYFTHMGAEMMQIWEPLKDKLPDLDVPAVMDLKLPLLKVDAAGTGCVMIHRRVLERTPYPWFRQEYGARGDLRFFLIAAEEGFDTYVDPEVICGHLKQELVTLKSFMERELAQV